MAIRGWLRRARPWLGTLVDIGVPTGCDVALEAAFDAIALAHRLMSLQEPGSDLSRAHAADVDEPVPVHPWTAEVLRLCMDLHTRSEGLFDVACGSGRWALHSGPNADDPAMLMRLDSGTRLDVGISARDALVRSALGLLPQHASDSV